MTVGDDDVITLLEGKSQIDRNYTSTLPINNTPVDPNIAESADGHAIVDTTVKAIDDIPIQYQYLFGDKVVLKLSDVLPYTIFQDENIYKFEDQLTLEIDFNSTQNAFFNAAITQ